MSPPTYWRLQSRGARWHIKQTAIRNGFTWEPMPPGVYHLAGDEQQRIRLMVENSFAYDGVKSIQVDADKDLWNFQGFGGCWNGIDRDTMLAIQQMGATFVLSLFDKAKEIAAQKRTGQPPAPPAPLPEPAEDGSGGLPS